MNGNTVTILVKARDEATATLNTVKRGMNDLASQGGKVGGVLKGAFGSVGSTVAGVARIAVPALGAVGIAVGALTVIGVKGASDLNESLSKARVVFGQNAGEIEKWAKTSSTAFGQSRQQALEAAGTFGNLFDALGLGERDVADMSRSVVELAADLSSFNNIPVDVSLEKLRAGLVGEVEPLRTLGVNLNAAMVEAKALEMGLTDANGEVSEAAKVQARYALILEQTTNAQGDFARTSSGVANQQRIFSAQWKDITSQLGQAALPVLMLVFGFLTGTALPALTSVTEGVGSFAEMLGAFASGDGPRALAAFAALPPPLKELALFLLDNQEAIKGFVSGARDAAAAGAQAAKDFAVWTVESGLLDTMLTGVETITTGVKRAGETLGPVVKDLTQFFKDNRVAAIALAVALAVLLAALAPVPAAILAIIFVTGALTKHWEELEKKTREIWEAIPEPIRQAMEQTTEIIEAQVERHKVAVTNGWGFLRDYLRVINAAIHGDVVGVWTSMFVLLRNQFTGWIDQTKANAQFFREILVFNFELARAGVEGAMVGIREVVDIGMEVVKNIAIDKANAAKDGVLSAWNVIAGFLMPLLDSMRQSLEWTRERVYWLRDAFYALRDAIQSAIDKINVFDDISGVIGGAVGRGRDLLNFGGLPGRATGIINSAQAHLALVGERGPELMFVPQHATIFPAQQTQQMLDASENRQLRAGTPAPTIVQHIHVQQLIVQGDPAAGLESLGVNA